MQIGSEAEPSTLNFLGETMDVRTLQPFGAEIEMFEGLINTASGILAKDTNKETWVAVPELPVFGRVADLLMCRINRGALADRLACGPLVARSCAELRVLDCTYNRRSLSMDVLQERSGLTQRQAATAVRSLERAGVLSQVKRDSYVRVSPCAPVFDKVVAFESKRSDWRGALVQARTYRTFAHAVYVLFDAFFLQRFRAALEAFRSSDIGLLALNAGGARAQSVLTATSKRPADHLSAHLCCEKVIDRLTATTVPRLHESRLPNASVRSACQLKPLWIGDASTSLERSLAGSK